MLNAECIAKSSDEGTCIPLHNNDVISTYGTSLPTIPMEFLYGTIACQRFRVIEDEDSDQHAIVFFRPAIKHYAHSKRLRFCSPDSDA